MITLQADPLIEWDEANTNINSQSIEAQNWASSNIMNEEAMPTMETIISSASVTWERTSLITYTSLAYNLVLDITYKNNDSCSIASTTYTLTQL